MFSNIFCDAKAHVKGGKNFPAIDGLVTFKEVSNGVMEIGRASCRERV